MKMTGAQISLNVWSGKESSTSSVTPAGWSSISMTNWPATPTSSISWCATNRPRSTPPTAMPGPLPQVGVALVTSGPGATNTVTGIASAYLDSIPIVVFTGQVPTALIGNDAFQEVDIVGITRPCTKHNYLVKDVKDLAQTIHEAFHIARSGRPGPVLVDLPKDVSQASTVPKFPEDVKIKSYNPTYHANPRQVARALDMILHAKKPVLYTGGGIVLSDSSEELSSSPRACRSR